MSKAIIGLVGQIACGKETVKKHISQKHNTQDCKFSTSLRDVVKRLNISESRENLQKMSTILRNTFGEDLLARIIASDASRLDSEIVVIDGVRRMADVKYLRELPNFHLIKIEVSPKLRFERMVVRNENIGDKDKTFEQFMIEEEYETEKSIPEVMSFAKINIDNNKSFDELYLQVDKIIADILKN